MYLRGVPEDAEIEDAEWEDAINVRLINVIWFWHLCSNMPVTSRSIGSLCSLEWWNMMAVGLRVKLLSVRLCCHSAEYISDFLNNSSCLIAYYHGLSYIREKWPALFFSFWENNGLRWNCIVTDSVNGDGPNGLTRNTSIYGLTPGPSAFASPTTRAPCAASCPMRGFGP
jgi:hypothetical protein